MGCCCSEPPIVNAPNDIPDPPPKCTLGFSQQGISKFGQSQTIIGGHVIVTSGQIVVANDAAWSNFGSAQWRNGFQNTSFASALSPTWLIEDDPHFHAVIAVLYQQSFQGNPITIVGSLYAEGRMYWIFPLITEVGGQQYSLEELYGITNPSISVLTNELQVGEDVWTTIDVHWGMISNDDVRVFGQVPTGILTENVISRLVVDSSLIGNGLADLASNLLEADVVVPRVYDEAFNTRSRETFEIDLTPVVDETGGDYLLILAKVPDDVPEQKTVTIGPISPGGGSGSQRYGPRAFEFWSSNIPVSDYLVINVWGCIMSMVVRIDVDANASDLVEEDRTKTATYLSGTGRGKKFRSFDQSIATFNTCNLVPISRIYSIANPIENWGFTFTDSCHESLMEALLGSFDLMHDDDQAGCHWTSSFSRTNCTVTLACPMFLWPWFVGVAPVNLTATVNWDLSITNAGSGNVDMLLTVTLSFSPDPGDPSHAVSYALNGQAASATGPFTLTATTDLAGRTYNPAGGTDEIVFPDTFELTTSSSPTSVERTCLVYLVESGGEFFLTFDYHRESDPNDPDYYIEFSGFDVEVGPGTAYETLGDIAGTRFSFDHPGANNLTTVNGTEDATIAFTIESFNLGGLFQSGFVG